MTDTNRKALRLQQCAVNLSASVRARPLSRVQTLNNAPTKPSDDVTRPPVFHGSNRKVTPRALAVENDYLSHRPREKSLDDDRGAPYRIHLTDKVTCFRVEYEKKMKRGPDLLGREDEKKTHPQVPEIDTPSGLT